MFSLPETYIRTRRYFILGANGLSIAFLVLGMVILLGNRYVHMDSISMDVPDWRAFQSSSAMLKKYSPC